MKLIGDKEEHFYCEVPIYKKSWGDATMDWIFNLRASVSQSSLFIIFQDRWKQKICLEIWEDWQRKEIAALVNVMTL